jgi:glycerophosphoryl diester phosphodiesterase
MTMTVVYIPVISDNWEDHSLWRGEGPMSSEDRDKLAAIVDRAHSKGLKIRFWNLPAEDFSRQRAVWAELISLGVDLISVDDLGGYRDFLRDFADREKLSDTNRTTNLD